MASAASHRTEDHVSSDESEHSSLRPSDAAGAASPSGDKEDLAFALRTIAETLKSQADLQKKVGKSIERGAIQDVVNDTHSPVRWSSKYYRQGVPGLEEGHYHVEDLEQVERRGAGVGVVHELHRSHEAARRVPGNL